MGLLLARRKAILKWSAFIGPVPAKWGFPYWSFPKAHFISPLIIRITNILFIHYCDFDFVAPLENARSNWLSVLWQAPGLHNTASIEWLSISRVSLQRLDYIVKKTIHLDHEGVYSSLWRSLVLVARRVHLRMELKDPSYGKDDLCHVQGHIGKFYVCIGISLQFCIDWCVIYIKNPMWPWT